MQAHTHIDTQTHTHTHTRTSDGGVRHAQTHTITHAGTHTEVSRACWIDTCVHAHIHTYARIPPPHTHTCFTLATRCHISADRARHHPFMRSCFEAGMRLCVAGGRSEDRLQQPHQAGSVQLDARRLLHGLHPALLRAGQSRGTSRVTSGSLGSRDVTSR